jgi:thiol-disulfide isomerase/thioredoxin
MTTSRRFASIAAAALIGVAGILGWLSLAQAEKAPPVDYVLLDGQTYNSSKWAGHVVLVNFWATSCATCVKEMPQIVATHQKYKAQGFDTVAVAMSYDPPAFVARYAETRGLPFGVAIDNTGRIAQTLGPVAATPTTLLINKRGEIVKRFVGEPDFAALHRLIEQLLAEA